MRSSYLFFTFLMKRLVQLGFFCQSQLSVFLAESVLVYPFHRLKAEVSGHCTMTRTCRLSIFTLPIILFVSKISYFKNVMCLLWNPDWYFGYVYTYQCASIIVFWLLIISIYSIASCYHNFIMQLIDYLYSTAVEPLKQLDEQKSSTKY